MLPPESAHLTPGCHALAWYKLARDFLWRWAEWSRHQSTFTAGILVVSSAQLGVRGTLKKGPVLAPEEPTHRQLGRLLLLNCHHVPRMLGTWFIAMTR